LFTSVLEPYEFFRRTGIFFHFTDRELTIESIDRLNRATGGNRLFISRFLSDHFGCPLVRSGIAITMENLGGVVSQEGVDLVAAIAPVSIQKVRQILRQAHNRNAFTSGRCLKQSILLHRKPVRLILPEEHGPISRRLIGASVNSALEE